jgi:hypothetical protein
MMGGIALRCGSVGSEKPFSSIAFCNGLENAANTFEDMSTRSVRAASITLFVRQKKVRSAVRKAESEKD